MLLMLTKKVIQSYQIFSQVVLTLTSFMVAILILSITEC
jgi:hypothetical protein